MRVLLALPLAVLAIAGCGDSTLTVGDCTDVDPTLVIEAIEPEKVDCSSEDAKSKVSAVEDSQEACQTEAMVQQGDSYYCLEPQGKTFRDELDEATQEGQSELDEAMEELQDELGTETTP